MRPCLLIDSSYLPLKTIIWQRALTLYFNNKVEILEHYEDVVHSPSLTMKTPAVVRLKNWFRRKARPTRFTRNAVAARDNYTCLYCGKGLSPKEVTLDHVNPKHTGAGHSFLNSVTACYTCNIKKGGRTPQQANMPLLQAPTTPGWFSTVSRDYTNNGEPEQWTPYLSFVK